MKQKNIGSSADRWLKEGSIREETSPTSRKRASERRMIKSATPDKLVILSTPETRRALSPTALRGFFSSAAHVVGALKPAVREMRSDKSQNDMDAGQRTPGGVATRDPEASHDEASP